MPGTFAVESAATFTSVMLVSSMPKEEFGSQGQRQEANAAGVPKWTIEAAVTFTPTPGMRPVSEMITVTIADRAQPGQGLNPGTPITFEAFRVGFTPPELAPGRQGQSPRIRGGKPWYTATGLRPVGAPQPSARREAAANS